MEDPAPSWRARASTLEVTTPRLRLSLPHEDVLPDLERLKADADVVRWLPYGPLDQEQVRERFERTRTPALESPGDALVLYARDRGSGAFVGEFLLILRSVEHRGWELGYIVDPRCAGRGLATEGARAMLHVAFSVLEAHRVVGRIYSEHAASARVLGKAGMRQEAHLVSNELLDGRWTDEDDFAVLEEEWRAQDLHGVTVEETDRPHAPVDRSRP